jgi:hypothetical protein
MFCFKWQVSCQNGMKPKMLKFQANLYLMVMLDLMRALSVERIFLERIFLSPYPFLFFSNFLYFGFMSKGCLNDVAKQQQGERQWLFHLTVMPVGQNVLPLHSWLSTHIRCSGGAL